MDESSLNCRPETRKEDRQRDHEQQVHERNVKVRHKEDRSQISNQSPLREMSMKNTLRGTKAMVEVEQDTEITLPSDPLGSEEMSILPGIEEEVDVEMTLLSDPARSAAILRRNALPGVEEKMEVEQDLDMDVAPALDYASAKEQDGESDQDEEEHVIHLLEGGEAESTTGKQNRKLSRAWHMTNQRIMEEQTQWICRKTDIRIAVTAALSGTHQSPHSMVSNTTPFKLYVG